MSENGPHKNLRLILDPDPNHSKVEAFSVIGTIKDALDRGYAVTFQPVDATTQPAISLVVYDMTSTPVNRMGQVIPREHLSHLTARMQEEVFCRRIDQCVMFLEGQRPVPS